MTQDDFLLVKERLSSAAETMSLAAQNLYGEVNDMLENDGCNHRVKNLLDVIELLTKELQEINNFLGVEQNQVSDFDSSS